MAIRTMKVAWLQLIADHKADEDPRNLLVLLEDKNVKLQERIMELENQLERANIANKNLEKEKDMILFKYKNTLKKLTRLYDEKIADTKDSGDDSVVKKETVEKN